MRVGAFLILVGLFGCLKPKIVEAPIYLIDVSTVPAPPDAGVYAEADSDPPAPVPEPVVEEPKPEEDDYPLLTWPWP